MVGVGGGGGGVGVREVAELMKLQGYGQKHCYHCN